jgi:hypothetical protein
LPKTLRMAHIMDCPTLRLQERVLRTFLFATLDGAILTNFPVNSVTRNIRVDVNRSRHCDTSALKIDL